MYNVRLRFGVLVGLTLSVVLTSACEGQPATSNLNYEQIIRCNVAVEHHFLSLNIASIKLHDGNTASIEREEISQRKKWLLLALATGKPPRDIEGDLRAERVKQTADGNQAEWNRLDDWYVNSSPSLRLMPYYKSLSVKERQDIRNRRDGIIKAADLKSENHYRQCIGS